MSEQEVEKAGLGNKPVETLRDGPLKVAIFRNQSERGESYSMVPGRIYTDKNTGLVRETTSFNANEALRVAHLMTKGHERVMHHRSQDQGKQKQAPERSVDQRPKHSRDSSQEDYFNREIGFDRER